MINTPSNWKTLLSQKHIFQYCLKTGNTVIDSGHLLSVPIGTDSLMDAYGCGNVVINEKEFRLINSPIEIKRKDRIEVYARIKTATTTSDWIPQGVYYARKPKVETSTDMYGEVVNITTFSAYDEMASFEYVPYEQGSSGWTNKTLRQVAQILSTQTGVALEDATQIPTYVMSAPPFGYTAREILSDIAKTCFGNWMLTYVMTGTQSNLSQVAKLRLVKMNFTPDPNDNVVTTNEIEAIAWGDTLIKVGY